MTERASDLLSEVADRLSADAGESGLVAAESVRSLAPEILKAHKDTSLDELVRISVKFHELLFRTLHTDSNRPGQLVGLFECPDCGEERRLPLKSGAEVA